MNGFVNGNMVPIRYTAVNMPPYNLDTQCGYLIVNYLGETEIDIIYEKRITSAVVRPLSLGIEPQVADNRVHITLKHPCNISVEVDGRLEDALLIFASEKREYREEGYSNIIRFEAGVHDIDELLVEQDDTMILIEENAVVHGRILARNARHLKICGQGVITMERYFREIPRPMLRCVSLWGCSDVDISDLCILDSCNWSLRLDGCDDVEVDNVKIIGCRGNADGIDVCGSRNVHVSNCFIRTYDDSFVVKGFDTGNVENVLFEKSVLWNDMARAMEIGVELRCEEVKNVVFRDIDVIHSLTPYPIFGIHHGDRARVSNIHFEDIRVEHAPGAQLFDIRITDSVWNKDIKKGPIEHVYIDNIRLVGEEGKDFRNLTARLEGFDEENSIRDVQIGTIEAYGKVITGADALGLEIRKFVEDVQFEDITESGAIKSFIEMEEAFTLCADGRSRGVLKLTLINQTKETVTGTAGLSVFPQTKAVYEDTPFAYQLEAGQRIEKEYEIIAVPGKYAVESRGSTIAFKSAVEYLEIPYLLPEKSENGAAVPFANYFGEVQGDVSFALRNGWLEVRSELLKEYDMCLYTAVPVETADNQILFSLEESYFGEAPCIKWKDGKRVAAPEIGNHWEIVYVFNNQPQVKEIKKVDLPRNHIGLIRIPLCCLGLDESVKHFWMEAKFVKETKNSRMPYTLFGSTIPERTAHMFCDFYVR